MWVLVVVCIVAAFVIAIAAQLNIFNLGISQLITVKRVTDDNT